MLLSVFFSVPYGKIKKCILSFQGGIKNIFYNQFIGRRATPQIPNLLGDSKKKKYEDYIFTFNGLLIVIRINNPK